MSNAYGEPERVWGIGVCGEVSQCMCEGTGGCTHHNIKLLVGVFVFSFPPGTLQKRVWVGAVACAGCNCVHMLNAHVKCTC